MKAFIPRSIILWNDLPPDIQALRTVASFKAGHALDLSFWSIFTILLHGIEEVDRHLL